MELYSPSYFFIVHLAQIQSNQLLLEAVTSIPQPSFLLVQLYGVIHPSKHVKLLLKFIIFKNAWVTLNNLRMLPVLWRKKTANNISLYCKFFWCSPRKQNNTLFRKAKPFSSKIKFQINRLDRLELQLETISKRS